MTLATSTLNIKTLELSYGYNLVLVLVGGPETPRCESKPPPPPSEKWLGLFAGFGSASGNLLGGSGGW